MKKEDQSIKLLRHILGSIDLSDIDGEEKNLSESDRRSYCAAIFSVFPRLEKDIKEMLYRQLIYANNESEDWSQVLISRGTCNGFYMLLEKWKNAATEYQAKAKEEEEKIDNSNPLPQI